MSGNSWNQHRGEGGTRGSGGGGGRISSIFHTGGTDAHGKVWRACQTESTEDKEIVSIMLSANALHSDQLFDQLFYQRRDYPHRRIFKMICFLTYI